MKRAPASPQTPVKQARISSFFTSPSSSKRIQLSEQSKPTSSYSSSYSSVNASSSSLSNANEHLTDEELARRLQDEWNNENSSISAVIFGEEEDPLKAVKHEMSPSPLYSNSTAIVKKEVLETTHIDLDLLDASIASIDLGTDIFVFDPNQVAVNYWPTKTTANDEPPVPTTPYALLAHAFALLSATRSRLAILTILTNLLRVLMRHDPEALLPAIYLVSNHIAPPYDGVELGLGGAIVNRAVRDVSGKSASQLRILWNGSGDPGDVAFEAKKDVKTLMGNRKPIEVMKLFATLHQIAAISGSGSSAAKLSHITKLLVASRGEETRFLVRTFHSHLRINAVRTTITSALARAFSLDGSGTEEILMVTEKERKGLLANPTKAKEKLDPRRLHLMDKLGRCEKLVREVRARHPNFSSIVPALLNQGLEKLSEMVPLRVGTPLSPMLGSITRSLPAMHTKLGNRAFVCEFKYDGQRVQIHAIRVPRNRSDTASVRKTLKGGQAQWVGAQEDIYVRLFSRHLEDNTSRYPDINNLIPLLMGQQQDANDANQQQKEVESFIMDAEVVALSLDGHLLPFQTLTNRSRKDVELNQVKVRVGIFAFDLMYLNGKSLLKTAFRKRRSLLHSVFPPIEPQDARIARFNHVKSLESNEVDDVEEFFRQARTSKCEGIMVKSLDHHWQNPGNSNREKSEMKEEEPEASQLMDEELSDTLEAAILEQESSDEDDGEIANSKAKGVNGRGKALLSTYEPDKRCESWLKVKKDYVDGIGDSLDLVPIGAWHGMGRKAAWWSPILMALYNPETGVYEGLCKVISGFTDAEYKSMKFERFVEGSDTCYNARKERCRQEYDTGGLLPDVYFEPIEVWEIRGADITLSPVYQAAKGLISEERGLSLRFPRFLSRRTDKNPEDATTPQQLADLYREQNLGGEELKIAEASGHVSDVDGEGEGEE